MSEATLGEVATAALTGDAERLLRNDALLREGERSAVEAVHQMRVATRRLRSDLRTFRTALDPGPANDLRGELGWLAGLLGAARDADVLGERLSIGSRELDPKRGQAMTEALATLDGQRASAHAALLQALSGDRYGVLRERLERLLRADGALAIVNLGKADRPAREALPRVMRRTWRRLERRVASLAQPPEDEQLHEVRIAAKRCRYAAEACAPVLGEPAERLARACKRLQTVLGDLNDAVLAERWLRDWAAGALPSPAARTAAEDLATLEQRAARRARARWREVWERTLEDAAGGRPL